jgi:carboxymethylenebutenolidase
MSWSRLIFRNGEQILINRQPGSKSMQGFPKLPQAAIDLYDEYTHITLDRRLFLRRLSELVGGTAAAYALLPLLEANYAAAAIIEPDDARITSETVSFDGPDGPVSGYLARPSAIIGPLPAVLVIHENRGLNPHIQDVVRRAAQAGFLAVGPDFLSPAGGTPEDQDQAREMISALDPDATLGNALSAVAYLKGHESSTGKVGAMGFCWGGGLANRIATKASDLNAAVAFYGRVPPAADIANIKARVLLHYAGLDDRINAGIPEYEAGLKQAGIDYELYVYEGVNHAFHNDTAAARYDKSAADIAWGRTVNFLTSALA